MRVRVGDFNVLVGPHRLPPLEDCRVCFLIRERARRGERRHRRGKKIHPRARDVHRDEVAIADARRTDSGALVYSTSTGNVRPGMVNMGQLKK